MLLCALPSAGHAAYVPRPATDVLVVGDSLATGMDPELDGLLPGRSVVWSVQSGITTPQGMRRLSAALLGSDPRTVVISLGTNDGPDPDRFATRVHRILSRIPAGACIVWPTLHRPARKGAFEALNRVLRHARDQDPRLVLVDWYREVATGAVLLPDGVHPDAHGFARRSHLVARAVRHQCD